MTKIMLRRCKKYGSIFAILPYDIADYKGNSTFVDRKGGHGAGDYVHMIETSKPVKEEEAKEFLDWLRDVVGYTDIKVITRINYRLLLEVQNYARQKYMESNG